MDREDYIKISDVEDDAFRQGVEPFPEHGGGDQKAFETHFANVPAAIVTLIAQQRERVSLIKAHTGAVNSCGAYVRLRLGWAAGGTEAERARARKLAADVMRRVERQGGGADLDAQLVQFVLDCQAARAPFEERRKAVEKAMRKAAHALPVWPWAAGVRGFGDLALAAVIGEAGDLSGYATVSRVWKRFGLAPDEEYPRGEKSTGRMIPRARRGRLYGDVTIPLFFAQSVAKRAVGGDHVGLDTQRVDVAPYRAAYDARRAHTAVSHPDWTKGHSHNDALRIMTKDLLRDLWIAWQGSGGDQRSIDTHISDVPAAPDPT